MSSKNTVQEVFFGNKVNKVPVSIRFDLWFDALRETGSEPDILHALNYPEVEDILGFQRTARFRAMPGLVLGKCNYKAETEFERYIEEYEFEGHVLRRVTHCGDSGLKGHITEYPLKSDADCRLFIKMLEKAKISVNNSGLIELIEDTGDKGWVMYIVNSCPAHRVMLDWIGYENFFLLNFDCPEIIRKIILTLEGLYRRDLWPVVKNIPADLILHGNHFSSTMTPSPLFLEYFLPYFVEFNSIMHSVNKKVVFHSDDELGDLMPLIPECGFDGADCLATIPLVKASMTDYLECWREKLVCWGGIPSIVFDSTYPFTEFKKHILNLQELSQNHSNIIIGASDNVMPGAEWKRLKYISEVFACRK